MRHECPMPLRTCLMRTLPFVGRFCLAVFRGPLLGCQTNVRAIYTASLLLARDRYCRLDGSMPRSRATCSTVVNSCNPFIAARTMLCGFVEPRLLRSEEHTSELQSPY